MRILVAEDSPDSRELLTMLLRNAGHTVVGVCDGREALAAIEKGNFEVVFMDEEMPAMSGLEATRAIRGKTLPQVRPPIIIGVSGNAAESDERRCLDAGMDAFLPKPIGMAALFGTLAMVSRGTQETAPAAKASPELGVSSGDLAAHLRRASGGNEKLAKSLVKTFLADAPRKLAALRSAVARKDSERMASCAHALKGSLGLFGAFKAVAAARNIVTIGRAGSLDGAEQEFRTLQEGFRHLRRELLALAPAAKPKRKPAPKPRSRRSTRR